MLFRFEQVFFKALNMPSHSKTVLSHQECREKICIVCFRPKAVRILTSAEFYIIRSNFNLDILNLRSDLRLPIGICMTHKLELESIIEEGSQPKFELVHTTFDFVILGDNPKDCHCKLCCK